MPLTEKQKQFLEAYEEYGDAIKAYKSVYKTDKKSEASIAKAASKLLDHLKIDAEIKDESETVNSQYVSMSVKNSVSIATSVDKDKLLHMLLQAYDKASDDKRGASAMISASLAIAKLSGVMQDDADEKISAPHFKQLMDGIKKARQRLQDH